MEFETPNPEDLELDFSLENGGCLITVRRYRDFNDETAQKLFPRSSASYVASNSYTLPANYFSEALWKNEKERLERVQGVWMANEKKLRSYVHGNASKDSRFLACMDKLTSVLNMCEWMLSMCWAGDRSKPPLPLHLYKARLSELKTTSALTMRRLKELFKDKSFIRKCRKASRNSFSSENSRAKSDPGDKYEESSSWTFAPIERIGEILSILDAAANAGENVSEALILLTEIRQISKSGSNVPKEEALAKMQELNAMADALEKAVSEGKDSSSEPKAESSKRSTAKNQAGSANLSYLTAETPPASITRKRGRPRSTKTSEDEEYVEKRKSTLVIADANVPIDNPSDDLISRVKRGQRNRRPARSFTPGWELSSPSPPPPKVRAASKATPPPPTEAKPPSLTSDVAVEATSPDSGRPSSNESSDTAATKRIEKPSDNSAQTEGDALTSQKPVIPAPAESLPSTPVLTASSVSSTSLYPAVTPIQTTPSNADFSTPSTSMAVTPHIVPNPPPLPQLDDQTVMAVLKERVQLGDVRLTLMNLMSKEGLPKYHFIPTIIEVVDKAIAALDNKDMIVYSIYKAAVEAGCSQLGTIMRASNPVDPTNQIATLAAAMGISPTPFTSLLQNTPPTASANSGYVGNMQRIPDVAVPRDQFTSPYSYAAAPNDPQLYPGYTERDVSSYLL